MDPLTLLCTQRARQWLQKIDRYMPTFPHPTPGRTCTSQSAVISTKKMMTRCDMGTVMQRYINFPSLSMPSPPVGGSGGIHFMDVELKYPLGIGNPIAEVPSVSVARFLDSR